MKISKLSKCQTSATIKRFSVGTCTLYILFPDIWTFFNWHICQLKNVSYLLKFDTCIHCRLTYFEATDRCNGDL